jgi:IclR family transcriptional regulator, KDG regulon repressor
MTGESSQTLARGLKLLDLVANGNEGVAVRDLVEKMGLPRSIVQRLLYTLEAEGYLERHPSQVGYRLAIKLWTLGCAAIQRGGVREIARPFLEQIANSTNEVTKLGILDGDEVVYLDKVDCDRAVRAFVPIGGRAPAHAVATGKAILAFLPGAPKQREELAAEFKQIRKRGFAVNRGEWEEGVSAIAAPIFEGQGRAIASIGVVLPSTRFTTAKASALGRQIAAAAAEISRKLGFDMAPEMLAG